MADIGISRRQKVFATMETTKGTLAYPVATDIIRPAGDAVVNQSPAFVNSEEKQDTLDVLDQFQNAMPPGDWTVPFYVRPAGKLSGTVNNSAPQGSTLIESLLGRKKTASGVLVSGALTDSATSVLYKSLSGELPDKGVIKIGTELVYYAGITRTDSSSGTLTACVRGYGNTTAAAASDGDAITLESIVYSLSQTSPSFSLWVESDHFVQGLSGCSPTSASLSVSNEGAVMLTCSGSGMQMVYAGTGAVTTNAAQNATEVVVDDAKKYSVGAKIMNDTKKDDASSAGYTITAINESTNTLTISPGVDNASGWTQNDVIKGWLPTAPIIGAPIESRHTGVRVDNVPAKFRTTEITINTPKQFISDEVGTSFPEDYVEDVREITMSLNLYFRKDDISYFTDGYKDNEVPVELTFGDQPGSQMVVTTPRNKLSVPTIAFEAPVISLSIPSAALGVNGEDSIEIRFE